MSLPYFYRRFGQKPAPLNPLQFFSVAVIVTLFGGFLTSAPADVQTGKQLPNLQVDPSWPQWPETWIQGPSAGIATDKLDNVWIIHRPASVTDKRACCKPAPAVMEFDTAGKLLQSWNGPGEGWPKILWITTSTAYSSIIKTMSGSRDAAQTGPAKTKS